MAVAGEERPEREVLKMRYELKSKRVLKGISAAEAAKLLGKSYVSYNKKESGEVGFTPAEMVVLADKLELTFDEFNRIFFDGKLALKG